MRRIVGPASYGQSVQPAMSRPAAAVDQTYQTNLAGFFYILKRSALPILLLTLASILAGLFYLSITPPTYSASATVLVDPRARKIVTEEITQGGLTSDLALVESQVPILSSDAVLGRVVDEQDLVKDPEFQFYQSSGLSGQIKDAIRGPRPTPDARNFAIERLSRAMKIHRAQKTYVLEVEVESNSPVKSARLANAIADAYIEEQRTAKANEARQANKMIDARLGELRDAVERAETRIDEFKKANQIVTSEGGVVVEQQLGKLNTELATARGVAAEARARKSEVEALIAAGASSDALPDAVKSQLIQKLREQYAQVSRRAASLGAQFQSRHPIMIDIRSQQREIRSQIQQELARIVAAAKTEADIAEKRETELLQALETAKSAVARTNTAKIRLRELERELNASRDLLSAFLVRAKETQEQQNLTSSNARIVSKASVPSFPSWPRPMLVLALAGLAGLGFGIATALTRDHFDNSVGQHATHATPTLLPTLAALPRLRPSRDQPRSMIGRARDALDLSSFVGLSDVLLALREPTTERAQPFKQAIILLLNQLLAGAPADTARTLLFVSPTRNSGTTSTVLALGYAAAQAGERVLLIDAASADPELSSVFGGTRAGQTSIMLDDKKELESLMTVDGETGLTILPIALADLRTLNIRQRHGLMHGIDQLRRDFDLIAVDAGALLEDAATLGLLPIADDVIVVARSGLTDQNELIYTQQLLSTATDNVLGTVVTMDPQARRNRVA